MAEPFRAAAPRLAELVRWAEGVDCFFDLDGTLAPIAPTPAEASLPPEVPGLLARLHRPPLATVAIVSGRALADLEAFFPSADYALAGNHGLELRLAGETLVHAEASGARPALAAVAALLAASVREIPGCLVEDKGLGVAVHFRNTPRGRLADVRDAVRAALEAAPGGDLLTVRPGKEVLEVRPARGGDKGAAVLRLIERRRGGEWRGRYLPLYAGDDLTDEDAFRVLRGVGVTVRVGAGPTAAACYLEEPEQVPVLLAWLAEAVEELHRSRRKG